MSLVWKSQRYTFDYTEVMLNTNVQTQKLVQMLLSNELTILAQSCNCIIFLHQVLISWRYITKKRSIPLHSSLAICNKKFTTVPQRYLALYTWLKNKTNHPILSNSHPSATANKAIHDKFCSILCIPLPWFLYDISMWWYHSHSMHWSTNKSTWIRLEVKQLWGVSISCLVLVWWVGRLSARKPV